MKVSKRPVVTCMLIRCLGFAADAVAQGPDGSLPRTMRQVIRGRQAAVSSMRAEATDVASRILQKGGNAFDAVDLICSERLFRSKANQSELR